MRRLDDRRMVADCAARARVLQMHSEVFGRQFVGCAQVERPAPRCRAGSGPGGDHRDRLRQRVRVDHVHVALRFGRPACERHRLGRGRALVEHRRVRRGEPGQVGDHGLEVEQRLEPSLADLRLIRRVRRVPGGSSSTLRRITAACACRSSRGRSWSTGAGCVAAISRSSAIDFGFGRRAGQGQASVQADRLRESRRPSARRPSRSRPSRACLRDVVGGWTDVTGGERRIQVRHGRAPKALCDGLEALPLCRAPDVTGRALPAPELPARVAVLLPERFRGGFAPSAPCRTSISPARLIGSPGYRSGCGGTIEARPVWRTPRRRWHPPVPRTVTAAGPPGSGVVSTAGGRVVSISRLAASAARVTLAPAGRRTQRAAPGGHIPRPP